ncbi:hypothetical protein G647_07151 [Cladophialophora carrionii CBS 160.54]|uniref:Enoyl-CoA hydratase n=1 Tax=Cladophialophora carrionii CBS 160.54 TaxID=1279043 RepID=V9D1J6_9EURO|nr:uncharacterized protein G647_07151 [Cladophialophora carrionii CBS 160.54]ETI20809.1 hypothetical protein G647_07151 [Cladophialophora carrionii CBS 160.54]
MAQETHYKHLTITQHGTANNIYVITLRRAPENRLNVDFAQELIHAYHSIHRALGQNSEGAVILRGSDEKFFCTGLDLDERGKNSFASSDGFYPLLATILDFPFPTIALITGHVFGGACLLTLAHDYRVMNSRRGFWQMPPVNIGLHHDGMGSLLRLKIASSQVRRKILLEAHKYTAKTALEDGIVDYAAEPGEMFEAALALAEKWKAKARTGVYGLLRDELFGEASRAYRNLAYVHSRETAREPKVKL